MKSSKDTSERETSTKISKLKSPTVVLNKPTVQSSSRQIPRVLVNNAIELHKTKSYVVNLIDQALSNHLGTMASDKYSNNDVISV